MHNAAYRALGLDGWHYIALPVPPELFAETARALRGSGYRGVNVTIPHKEAALALADHATPAATAIGAANTLSFGADGSIEAENTDAGGFLDALGDSPRGWRAIVLGAGGAARAVVWALREAEAEVLVWNRGAERAAALAAELGVEPTAHPVNGDLLVNATAVGLDPAVTVNGALEFLRLSGIQVPAVVVDLVYGAAPTPVARWGAAGGARVVEGVEVLVRQGARSFERWTGLLPDLEVMRGAARR
jgi:shikimate dehydrogenase